MNNNLYTAALEGDIDSLGILINQDPLVLDRTTAVTAGCLETPLHVAALRGHDHFVAELLRVKPGLAREVDWQGSLPLHLAAFKGHAGTVRALLAYGDSSMCFARDKDGRNPVHVAAMMGRVDALKEMLQVEPSAAHYPVSRRSVLHLCVEHSRLEALKLMLDASVVNHDLINSKDEYGNTILHLCAINKQVEIMELLLSMTGIEVNLKNLKGMTAMDILVERRTDTREAQMEEFLVHAGALQSKGGATFVHMTKRNMHGGSTMDLRKNKKEKHVDKADWLEKKQSAIMVVATILASMAFQVGVDPPDEVKEMNGFWPSGMLGKCMHFYIVNTIGFIASLSIIFLLMSGLPLKNRVVIRFLLMITWVSITATAMTYTGMLITLTTKNQISENYPAIPIIILVWICLTIIILLAHTLRLLVKMVKWMLKLLRRMRPSTRDHQTLNKNANLC